MRLVEALPDDGRVALVEDAATLRWRADPAVRCPRCLLAVPMTLGEPFHDLRDNDGAGRGLAGPDISPSPGPRRPTDLDMLATVRELVERLTALYTEIKDRTPKFSPRLSEPGYSWAQPVSAGH
jgi:hypothetical protein